MDNREALKVLQQIVAHVLNYLDETGVRHSAEAEYSETTDKRQLMAAIRLADRATVETYENNLVKLFDGKPLSDSAKSMIRVQESPPDWGTLELRLLQNPSTPEDCDSLMAPLLHLRLEPPDAFFDVFEEVLLVDSIVEEFGDIERDEDLKANNRIYHRTNAPHLSRRTSRHWVCSVTLLPKRSMGGFWLGSLFFTASM